MNGKCEDMEDYIIKYINGQLDRDEKMILFNHISICSDCRKNLACILELQKMVSNMEKEVPEDVMKYAFSTISNFENEEISQEQEHISKFISSLCYVQDVVNGTILTTKKSIKLAFQLF